MKIMKDCHMCGGTGEGNCFHGWHPNVPCDWCNGTGRILEERKKDAKKDERDVYSK